MVGRLPRRELLRHGGAALAALSALAGCATDRRAAAPADTPDLSTWEAVRAAFDLGPGTRSFTAFLLASHPRTVRAAIDRHRRGLDADPSGYLAAQERPLDDAVLAAAARYVGSAPEQIALTDSTTMGLGLLYGGLLLEPGEEVVTTEHDFYATHEALRLRATATGATVRRIRLYHQIQTVSADEIVSAIVRAIGPRTRCVAVTWVHSSTGLKLPIQQIAGALADLNRQRGAGDQVLLCVDGVHGFGVEDVAVSELGCDFFSAGCHKWLFGPRGTGLLWGTPRAWGRVAPTIPSFDGRSYAAWLQDRLPTDLPPAAAMTPGGFHSFEHRWALADAFAFHDQIGRQRIAERTHALAGQLKEGLAAMRHVSLKTPLDAGLSAGLVCFDVTGSDPRQVVDRLREERRIVASVTPYATSYVRFGPSILNDPDEVAQAVHAIRALG